MADGKYGTKAQRLRAANAARSHEQSVDDFVAAFLTRKENRIVDDREFVIRNRDGEYFKGWEPTGWETVKGFALWTRDKSEAIAATLQDLPKIGYMDLICGFSSTQLERVK